MQRFDIWWHLHLFFTCLCVFLFTKLYTIYVVVYFSNPNHQLGLPERDLWARVPPVPSCVCLWHVFVFPPLLSLLSLGNCQLSVPGNGGKLAVMFGFVCSALYCLSSDGAWAIISCVLRHQRGVNGHQSTCKCFYVFSLWLDTIYLMLWIL